MTAPLVPGSSPTRSWDLARTAAPASSSAPSTSARRPHPRPAPPPGPGGAFPELARVHGMESRANPYNQPARKRMDWAKKLDFDIPVVGGYPETPRGRLHSGITARAPTTTRRRPNAAVADCAGRVLRGPRVRAVLYGRSLPQQALFQIQPPRRSARSRKPAPEDRRLLRALLQHVAGGYGAGRLLRRRPPRSSTAWCATACSRRWPPSAAPLPHGRGHHGRGPGAIRRHRRAPLRRSPTTHCFLGRHNRVCRAARGLPANDGLVEMPRGHIARCAAARVARTPGSRKRGPVSRMPASSRPRPRRHGRRHGLPLLFPDVGSASGISRLRLLRRHGAALPPRPRPARSSPRCPGRGRRAPSVKRGQ